MNANGFRLRFLELEDSGASATETLSGAPVPMMLDRAFAGIAAAEAALAACEIARKDELVSEVVDLFEQLRVDLDRRRGGKLAVNLDALYRYMSRRLLDSRASKDASPLVEVSSLLRELESGWAAIAATLNGDDDREGEYDDFI